MPSQRIALCLDVVHPKRLGIWRLHACASFACQLHVVKLLHDKQPYCPMHPGRRLAKQPNLVKQVEPLAM